MTSLPYNVAIIGSGPAGMFAALELARAKPGLRIAMLEKGPFRSFDEKTNLTCGWGGSGAFSDGKLNHTAISGGQLRDFLAQEEFEEIMRYVDTLYLEFGGDPKLVNATSEQVKDLRRQAIAADLELVHFPIRHLGTDKSRIIVDSIRQYLERSGEIG